MYIRNTWYVAAEPAEIADGRLLARTILDKPVVIGRTASGKLLALHDRCPHRFMPLSLGRIDGESLRCLYHGARFDCSGACVEVPGQDAAPPQARVRSYPLAERHGYIWIWMGDPALAEDRSTIPDFLYRSDHPGWDGGYGRFESIRAGYRLINDNLIDITHAEFVHPESFGCEQVRLYRNAVPGEDYVANGMTFESGTRAITYRMRSLGIAEEAPFYRWMVTQGLRRDAYPDPIDLDMQVNWAAPSFTSFLLNARPAGAPLEQGFQVCNMHLVTPETDTSSHYFFRSVKNFGDAELTAKFMDGVRAIFSQDRPLLEAQQRRVGTEDLFAQRPISFAGDMLQLKARRMVQALEQAEAAAR
jgi:vanillate O-demethylase monooxygenase subunit